VPAVDVVVYAANAGPFYGAKGIPPGGAELQSYYLARALASAGLRTRHVVADAGLSRTPEGVEVFRLPADYAVPGLRRRRAIVEGLRRSDGQVYIQRTAGIETGFAGVYARLARRRFVFSASHDADFLGDRELRREAGGGLESWTARTQARLGMRCAHAVVAQTEHQGRLARSYVGREPRVIPSFCELGDPRPRSRDVFLWVGGFFGFKDPQAFLDLAERVPAGRFVMVARERAGWEALAAAVHSRAGRLSNVELLPAHGRAWLLEWYDRSLAVVNTSVAEGFSNVFLEGWARGVPTLSLRVDPDGVIARQGLGGVAGGSIDELARFCRQYVEDPSVAESAGAAGYRYVRETHSPDVVGPKWVALVEELLGEGVRGRRDFATD
jgi:glycosyltransferase involved in cell wall biosynthesis